MNRSEQINEIAAALSKAQAMMKTPEKNCTAKYKTKTGYDVEFDYADLPEIINVSREALSANGLAHTCLLNGNVLESYLLHTSGQWLMSVFNIPETQDIKGFAGHITYGTRYMLQGLLGLAATQDKDGEPERDGQYSQKGAPNEQGAERGDNRSGQQVNRDTGNVSKPHGGARSGPGPINGTGNVRGSATSTTTGGKGNEAQKETTKEKAPILKAVDAPVATTAVKAFVDKHWKSTMYAKEVYDKVCDGLRIIKDREKIMYKPMPQLVPQPQTEAPK